MERSWFDNELSKIQSQNFGNNEKALIELTIFSMLAGALGYRGRAAQLIVEDKKIILCPLPPPKEEENSKEILFRAKLDELRFNLEFYQQQQCDQNTEALKSKAKNGKAGKKHKSRSSRHKR